MKYKYPTNKIEITEEVPMSKSEIPMYDLDLNTFAQNKTSLTFEYKIHKRCLQENGKITPLPDVEILVPYFTGTDAEIGIKEHKWKDILFCMEYRENYDKGDQESCFLLIEHSIEYNISDEYEVGVKDSGAKRLKHLVLYGRDPEYTKLFDEKMKELKL